MTGDVTTGAFTLGGVGVSGCLTYLSARWAAGHAEASERRRAATQRAAEMEAMFAEYLGSCERTAWKLRLAWAAKVEVDVTVLLDPVFHQAAAISLQVPPRIAEAVYGVGYDLAIWATRLVGDPEADGGAAAELYETDRDALRATLQSEVTRSRADSSAHE